MYEAYHCFLSSPKWGYYQQAALALDSLMSVGYLLLFHVFFIILSCRRPLYGEDLFLFRNFFLFWMFPLGLKNFDNFDILLVQN